MLQTASPDGLTCVNLASCSSGQMESFRTREGGLSATDCLTCSSSYFASDNQFSCDECSNAAMSGSDCNCPGGFNKLGGSCIPTSAATPSSSAYFAPFSSVPPITSTLIQNLLPSAYYNCQTGTNRTACQLLANLCALQMYQLTTDDNACTLYVNLVEAGAKGLHGISSWPVDLPWLYYDESDQPQYNLDVNVKGSFDHSVERNGDTFGKLQLVVAVYSLRGEFRGFQDLTDQFQLCDPVRPSISDAWLWFGTTFSLSCTVLIQNSTLDATVAESDPLFFEPYLVDVNSSGGTILYPLPVQVNGDTSQLYRRMFLFDNVTANGEFVRIASNIHVHIRVRDDEDGRLYPPTIEVEYSELQTTANGAMNVEFQVSYTLGLDDYETSFLVVCIIVGVLAFCGAYIRIRASRERNGEENYNLNDLAGLAYEFGALFSTGLYFVLCGTALYILLFYKASDAPYVLPPDEESDQLFERMMLVAVSCKVIHVLYVVYMQCHIDLVLIDWENPKGGDHSGNQVSLWRTVLIANEYNEIQTLRKVSISVVLLLSLFFYEVNIFGSPAKELALENVETDRHDYEGNENAILRFATAALLFNVIGLVLWLLHKAIRVKLFGNPFLQFSDLCSISNISIMALTHQHRGFYLHGKSVHGHAEVGISAMRKALQDEESNNTSQRGLAPQSDEQLFEVYLPAAVRDKWDSVLLSEITEGQTGETDTAATSKAYHEINEYLKGYLSHSFSHDINYRIQEKTILQRLMMASPEVTNEGVFYIDNSNYFTEILFLGNEGSLFIFEALIFMTIDWYATDWILSTVVVFFVSMIIARIRDHYGRVNLARKTLVNECFLI